MTSKQQALYSLMEERGYSPGLIVTAVQIVGQSAEALDELIDYIYEQQPLERAVIEKIAEICS